MAGTIGAILLTDISHRIYMRVRVRFNRFHPCLLPMKLDQLRRDSMPVNPFKFILFYSKSTYVNSIALVAYSTYAR